MGSKGWARGVRRANAAVLPLNGRLTISLPITCRPPSPGLGGAWVGLTVQHCGNHGAMSTNAAVNGLMGLTSDLVGGSSLMWRYHHQVSHHIHCNGEQEE